MNGPWLPSPTAERSRTGLYLVCLAAILPYLPTINDYFVRDDFGVVQLLAQKPASSFLHWFGSSWMDDIWGFVLDEVRPFPAASYQLTALGGAASPVLHHVFNILLHAINGLLVVAVARLGASLSPTAATIAGLAFVLLPVHTETVAWITGRVDSMPALFYLASFLAYVRWRQGGAHASRQYLYALALFFVALFTKQNTITMVGTLVAYDVLVLGAARVPLRPIGSFVRPYVPFAVMTAGYLWLRYQLFGQAAREGALTAEGFRGFLHLIDRHLRHVVTGETDGSRVLVGLVLAGLIVLWLMARRTDRQQARAILYFGPVWWTIGVAPIAVAGYASPRHVYLAAVGWAVVLGIAFEMLDALRHSPAWRRGSLAAAALVLVLYLVPLSASIREWNTIAGVSHAAVRDVRVEALAAPPGSLIIVGAPDRSWEWALPFATRPPFTRTDLSERVFIIAPRPLYCCAGQWFADTRRTLTAWSTGPARDSAVALRWDPDTAALARVTERERPDLPSLARALLDLDQKTLDVTMRRMIEILTGGT